MLLGLPIARSLVALLVVAAGVCLAEEAEPGFGPAFLLEKPAAPPVLGRPTTIALSPFQPAGVSTRIRRTLLQYEALVADEAWDEAIDLIETLQNEAGDQLTKLPAPKSAPVDSPEGHVRYIPLRRRCQQLLASLPPAGIEAYRDRVDRTARQRLDTAIEDLDELAAARVAAEFQPSDSAPEARLAAAELAFQRGDTAAARRQLQGLHPLTRDPYGRPAGASLAWLRPDADPAQLAAAWRDAVSTPQAATQIQDELLPTTLARLALVSLSEGDTRRAAAERLLLSGLAPDAEGRIAGRQQPLGIALDALLAEHRSIASQSGQPVHGDLTWAWEQAALFAEPTKAKTPAGRPSALANGRILWQQQLALRNPVPSDTTPSPAVTPVAEALSAFFVEANQVKRLRLTDGGITEFKLPGLPDHPPPKPAPQAGDLAAQRLLIQGRAVIRFRANGIARQVPQGPSRRIDPALTITDGLLFARVVEMRRGARRGGAVPPTSETLIGVDPARPSVAAVRLAAPRDPEKTAPVWQFGGPPVVRGERLYVAMTTSGGRVNVGVACYSTASGRRQWFTELGSGSVAPRLGGGTVASVTPAGDTLYVATELGAVVALEAASGRVRWLAQHPRDAAVVGFRRAATQARARPCHVFGDQVIVAPGGSTRLLAWDATSGRPLWDATRPKDASIAGVVRSPRGAVVVLAGRQVTTYDTLTGRRRLAWPESAHAGLRGVGAATVVGGEVFWPTRDAIYTIDPVRGGFTRPPIALSPVSKLGANLVATDAGLLVCGPKRLRLLADPENPEPTTDLSRLMDVAPQSAALAQQEVGTADERR